MTAQRRYYWRIYQQYLHHGHDYAHRIAHGIAYEGLDF